MLIRSQGNKIGTAFEDDLRAKGYGMVAGVDEVGRGPMAGPVVTCAVILPAGLIIDGIDDSKKLSPKKRESLAAVIKEKSVAYAYGIVDAKTIDRINILQAALLAMKYAVEGLGVKPDAVLVDGNKLPDLSGCYMQCVVQGDSKSQIIAAASILAKVKRDDIMDDIHKWFPQYGFDKHRGYGTVKHRAAVEQFGLCDEHRVSFRYRKG